MITAETTPLLVKPKTASSKERFAVELPTVRPAQGFLFSPWIDLFFIANVFWPAILLVDYFGGIETHQSLLFWQIFFITAPHRWITLVLVSVDHQKGVDRRKQFALFGTAILLGCLCLRMGTGSLLCLGMIDYLWNAWHFASQHHGVYRIYSRRSRPSTHSADMPTHSPTFVARQMATIEKIMFRGFILYAIARLAGWGWSEGPFPGFRWVSALDGWILIIPAFLIGRQIWRYLTHRQTSVASLAYLLSVMTLFTFLLVAAHVENSQWVVLLALASAIFHSLEYMSVVTWSMGTAKARNPQNALARLSKMWVMFLAAFVIVIGLGNYFLSRGYFEFWVFINIVVAFWHYCFDGMIWKSSKTPTAPAAMVARS